MERDEAQMQLGQTQTALGQVRGELASTRTELSETQATLGETQTELGETQTTLDETQTELGETQTELGETQAALGETRSELDETQATLGETQTELGQTRAELEQSQTELGETQTMLSETQSELMQVTEDLTTRTAELMAASTELDSTKMQLEAAQATGTTDAMTIAGLRQEVEDLTTQVADQMAEVMKLMGDVDDLMGQVTDLTGQVTALTAERDKLMDQRDTLQGNKDLVDARNASKTAKALLASLIDVDTDPTGQDDGVDPAPDNFPVLNGVLWSVIDATTDPANPTGTTRASVSANSMGEVTVSVTGYGQTENAPDMIDGFRSVELTKDMKQLWVYTDIDDATPTPINDVYDSTKVTDKDPKYRVQPTEASATDRLTTGTHIEWTHVRRYDTAEFTETIRASDGTTDEKTTNFLGEVRGLQGRFMCDGDNDVCTAPLIDPTTDALAGDLGAWYFVPVDPNGDVDVPDGNGYLAFGWWLNKRGDDQPDDEKMNVDVFAMASGLTKRSAETGDVAGAGNVLDDSATYSGGAAGKYAIAHTAEDTGADVTHEGGHFTATATFTANFDADADGVDANGNDENGISLEGRIDGFMTRNTADEYMARPGWLVTLTYDTLDDTAGTQSPTVLGDIATADDVLTADSAKASVEWDNGGAVNGEGNWSAMYYGGNETTDLPTAVIGEFEATVSPTDAIAHIEGAFAATIDDN